jgi:hypothetical protein
MEPTAQKSLPLILAREFAANLATPMVLMDERGSLVFFNEPAEQIIGQTHAEVGELGPDEWGRLFKVEKIDGTPVAVEKTPAGVTLAKRRPAHDTLAFTTIDGVRHEIAVTAFPLLGREDELLGVVSVFWENPDS